jgi:hypothetical protein
MERVSADSSMRLVDQLEVPVMSKKSIAVATAALGLTAAGSTAGESIAATSCSASTRPLAAGYAAPGACVAQAKCTRGVCEYVLTVRVVAGWAAGHGGRITGQARWAWFSPKFNPITTTGNVACTAFSGFQTSCTDLARVDVFVHTTLRVLCTVPAGLLPVRFVLARVSCSLS